MVFNPLHLCEKHSSACGIKNLTPSASSSIEVKHFEAKLYDAMNDDFNTPIAIAHLFDLSKIINQVKATKDGAEWSIG